MHLPDHRTVKEKAYFLSKRSTSDTIMLILQAKQYKIATIHEFSTCMTWIFFILCKQRFVRPESGMAWLARKCKAIFYKKISFLSLLGYGPMTLLQLEYHYMWGYVASVSCLLLASLAFILPQRRNYNIKKVGSNVIRQIFGIVRNALQNRKQSAYRR